MTNPKRFTIPTAARFTVVAFMLILSGCMQIDTRIKLNEDGSATITEKLRFGRKLLEMSGAPGSDADIAGLLSKEVATERAKHFGKGTSLVSYDVKDMEGGSRESVAVYKIDDINDLQYVSPWLAYLDYGENNVVKCHLEPAYKSRPYANAKAGQLAITFNSTKPPKGEPPLPKGATPPPGPVPRDLQIFRDLQPLFQDMMKDFKLRLTFESYGTITHSGLGLRGAGANPTSIELLDFSDKNLDKYGSRFVENEELMLDLIRWNIGSPTIVDHVRSYAQNDTLPVLFPAGSKNMWFTGGNEICIRPSRALFDKYFAGKKLDYSEWQASPPDKHVPAEFDSIGNKSTK